MVSPWAISLPPRSVLWKRLPDGPKGSISSPVNNVMGGTPDLEVEVNITRRDIGRLSWHLVLRNKAVWIMGTVLGIAVLWSALKGSNGHPEPLKVVILTLVVGIMLILFVIFWAGVSALAAMLMAGRGAGVLGRHLYRIGEDGLRETTSVNDSLMHWQGIMAIKEMGAYLLVFQTPVLAHAFPRRCFADGGDFAIFAAALREKMRVARGESR